MKSPNTSPYPLTDKDRQEILAHGLTEQDVYQQLTMFQRGIPPTILVRPATIGDGIKKLDPKEIDRYRDLFRGAAAAGRVTKFVPASGAASRMFKALLSERDKLAPVSNRRGAAKGSPPATFGKALTQFLNHLQEFAFYEELCRCAASNGDPVPTLLKNGDHGRLLDYLLTPQGLNYANLPKGLLPFHRYADHVRTAVEEHLVEARTYARDSSGKVRVHFTVSPDHQDKMTSHINQALLRHGSQHLTFDVSLSPQHSSTDTVAVDTDNRLFRDRTGHLVFRPGGHGALLRNLNDLQGDIVFIKNIDNVCPDHLKGETYMYKMALGGLLLEIQAQISSYVKQLYTRRCDGSTIKDIWAFVKQALSVPIPHDAHRWPHEQQIETLIEMLDRPIRVCGVVRNTGDPGGGPFWVKDPSGTLSLQIVESAQIDSDSSEQQAIFAAATHFNPVDMVCSVRDFQGRPFDLSRFVDHTAGFITMKSHEGRELKALELPGLWNGSMAQWITIFVEVPRSTFTPVKTVLDLIGPEHLPEQMGSKDQRGTIPLAA